MGQINREFSMVTGRVKNIRFKKKATPDKYGKTDTSMFWVDGVEEDGKGICFLGGVEDKGRGTRIAAKLNGDWDELCDGDEVKFEYKQSGTFYNYKAIHITKKGNGTPPAQNQQQQQQNPTTTTGRGYDPNKPNPAEVGQCINLAVETGIAKDYDDLLNFDNMYKAIKMYKQCKEQYTLNWDNVNQEADDTPVDDDEAPF